MTTKVNIPWPQYIGLLAGKALVWFLKQLNKLAKEANHK